MKAMPLMLLAAALVASGTVAYGATRDVRDYLQRAGKAAAARVADAGIDVGGGLDVKARVDADGRLAVVRVVKSTGSHETDQLAVAALKRVRVAGPPNALLGADVTIAVTRAPLVQASK